MKQFFILMAFVGLFATTVDAQVYRIEGTLQGATVTLNIDLDNKLDDYNNFLCAVIVSKDGEKLNTNFGGAKMFENENIYVTFQDGSTLMWYRSGNGYKVTLGDYTVQCSVRKVQ